MSAAISRNYADEDSKESGKSICGVICVIFTYILILFIAYSVYYLELLGAKQLAYFQLLTFSFFALMAIWAHVQATFSDPGVIPRGLNHLRAALLPEHVLLYYKSELNWPFEKVTTKDLAGIPLRLTSDQTQGVEHGKVPRVSRKDKERAKLVGQLTCSCLECRSIKPPKTHHCNECGRSRADVRF